MPLVYLALGSNLGDRLGNLRTALKRLQMDYPISLRRTSSVYENRAIGMGEADDFFNAIAEVETELAPEALLDACLEVEEKLGRKRSDSGWIPRTIDLDLIHYEGASIRSEKLTLPHPRIAERDFVAVPLGELAPDLEIDGKFVHAIIRDLGQNDLRLTKELI